MFIFIELHARDDGSSIWVSLPNIASIHQSKTRIVGNEYSVVKLMGDSTVLEVKETPQDILQVINKIMRSVTVRG